MAERLQKFLAKSGIGSRRYCEELIKSKRIKVNGQIALIGASVNKDDEVEYDGKIISPTELEIKLLILTTKVNLQETLQTLRYLVVKKLQKIMIEI